MQFSMRTQLLILTVLVTGLFFMISTVPPAPEPSTVATTTQVSASAASSETVPDVAESKVEAPDATSTVTVQSPTPPEPSVAAAEIPNPNQIRRIKNPYSTASMSFEAVNTLTRAALVNIYCISKNPYLRPISGSGVFIDSRGIILTNAHVAQYVLLAESGRVNLECQIRAGSPARAKWRALVLYIPPVWIDEHAQDLKKEKPLGTGKHDFALLYAGASLDGLNRPTMFPYLSSDTREAIGFVDDPVLAGSYPAEFLGAIASNFDLNPVTSITKIDELYTLSEHSVDVLSIGSVIGAQSGSSGGAIVNAWARLIGIITTTSDGATTGERRLRGITLSYVDRDLSVQSGYSLSGFLSLDPMAQSAKFWAETAPSLVEKLLAQVSR